MSEAVDDPFGLAGTTLERRFAIDRVVARGGFGVVYQGRHLTLKKPVAIKVLMMPTGLGMEEKKLFLQSFEQEAQTIAALEHPAIVRAYDFGIARPPGRRELPWLALEWIDGESLEDRLVARAGSPMAPAEALALLRPVLQALAFAHAHHIAHRDLKPANIMLPTGADGVGVAAARLLDFGIAKVMNPDEAVGSGATRTMAAFSAFSAPYAAPEQKAGRKTGPWTDVHAMGLILTELVTGRPPYGGGDDPVATELAILSPDRPTPRRFGVDVGALEPVFAKAVALNPPDRYADASALLTALEAAAHAPSPPVASPASPQAASASPVVFAQEMQAVVAIAAPAPSAHAAFPPTSMMQGPAMPAQAPVAPPGYSPPTAHARPPVYAPPVSPPAAMGYAAPAQAPGYGYTAPPVAPPAVGMAQPSRARTFAIVSGAVIFVLVSLCLLCLAIAPDKTPANTSPAQPSQPAMQPMQPGMQPMPSR